MNSQEDFELHSKVVRCADKRNIHNFLIFNKSGICLYARNFTDIYRMEEHLLSSFCFAIMSFSKEIIGDKVRTIEMNGVKYVIIEKKLFYYGILCKTTENINFLEDIVSKIHKKFIEYVNVNSIDINHEYTMDEDFNMVIEDIFNNNLSDEYDLEKESKIIEYLKELSYNDEIEGLILVTDKGNVVYSSFKRIDLKIFLKEVDFRVKICNNSILKMFYTSKENHYIFSEYVGGLYFIILVFDNQIKFGMAEYYLHKIVKSIHKILDI